MGRCDANPGQASGQGFRLGAMDIGDPVAGGAAAGHFGIFA